MRLTLTRRGLLIASAAAGGLWLAPAARAVAETGGVRRALLVGVTEYPELPPRNWLRGPGNDVTRMREWLLANPLTPFAPEHITVLADGLEVADASPTLAAIRGAMADMAAAAGPGDIVYLQFSGHGHQQPARFAGEIDGLDEVFMPRDVGIMRRGMTEWPNAYVDKDIKADIDAIRAKGAFVWALFDCCHSATMTRNVLAGDASEVARQVDLSEVQDYAGDAGFAGTARGIGGTPRQTMLGPVEGAPGMGGLVAFYASQTIEPTFELPLPPGAEDAVQMGLFTFAVMSRLAATPALTYRQLGEAVLQSYAAMNRRAPIPMFEGDEASLNAPVLGTGATDYLPQWPLRREGGRAEIAGGAVHGLVPGTRLMVLPDPAAGPDEALGLVEVASVTSLRSVLGPLAEGGPDPAALEDGVWLRMAERVIEMELAVALPRPSAEAEAVTAMLEALAADAEAPFRLRLVAPDAPADIRLDVMARRDVAELMMAQGEALVAPDAQPAEPELWLLDAGALISLAPGRVPPSLNLVANGAEAQAAWLRETMTRVYRATQLARLSLGDDLTRGGQVTVEVYLKRGGREVEPISPAAVPRVRALDEVWVRVANNSSTAVDVHTLFIGTDFAITPSNFAERLQPGNVYDRGQFRISDATLGRERVVVALAEAEPMAPVLNLAFLGQEGVRTRGAGASGGAAAGLRALLADVAEAPMTRGAMAMGGDAETARGALFVYSLDVVPTG